MIVTTRAYLPLGRFLDWSARDRADFQADPDLFAEVYPELVQVRTFSEERALPRPTFDRGGRWVCRGGLCRGRG